MKIKSFLLGSAAAAVAATGVQAADLPAVEPVEYVKVCDAFGAGFWYIPGSENCIKFSGFVRFDITYDDDDKGDDSNESIDDIQNSTTGDADWDFGGRTRLDIDVRSQTELGTLRAFMRLQGDLGSNGEDAAVEIDLAFLQFGLGGGIVTMGEIGLASNMNGTWTDDGPERIDEDPLGIRYDYSFGDVTLSASISDPDGIVGGAGSVSATDNYVAPDFAIGLDYSGDVFNAEIGANTVQFDDAGDTENDFGFLVGGTVGVDFDRWRARAGATYYADAAFLAIDEGVANQDAWAAYIGGQFDATDTLSLQATFEYAHNDDAVGVTTENQYEIEAGFTWTPVTNFSILGEVVYENQEDANGADADDFRGLLRFTRSF